MWVIKNLAYVQKHTTHTLCYNHVKFIDMKKEKIEKIEDIYPLTIVTMRYGGNVVIFNSESDNSNIHEVQLGEEPYYKLNEWMKENVSPQCYGIGDTVWNAFEDYKKRHCGY